MHSAYAYSCRGFQTLLQKGIFEPMNLLSFFLKSGRETIFSAYTTDVNLCVSFFSSVFGELFIIWFIIRPRDIWHAHSTFWYFDQD